MERLYANQGETINLAVPLHWLLVDTPALIINSFWINAKASLSSGGLTTKVSGLIPSGLPSSPLKPIIAALAAA